MPTEQTKPDPERASETLSFDEATVVAQQAGDRAYAAHELLVEAFDSWKPGALQQKIEEAMTEIDALQAEGQTVPESILKDHVQSFIDEEVPPDVAPDLQARFQEGVNLDYEWEMAQEVARQAATREAAQLRTELLNTVDWDKAVTAQLDDYRARPLQNVIHPFVNPRHDQPSADVYTLREWQHYLAEQEMMRPAGAEDNEAVEQWHASGNLKGALEEWSALTGQALEYLGPARRHGIIDQVTRAKDDVDKLAKLAGHLGLDGQGETHAPAVIADAVERVAGKVIDNFNQQDEQVINSIAEGSAEMLFVGQPSLLEKTTNLEPVGVLPSGGRLIESHLDLFPPKLIKGLGSIQFTEKFQAEYEAEKAANPQREIVPKTTGMHQSRSNGFGNEILIDVHSLARKSEIAYRVAAAGETEEEARRKIISRKIPQTLDHEIGHHLHKNTLPIADIQEWIVIVRQEQMEQSDHIELLHSLEKSALDISMEDFADSVSSYLNEPGKLLVKGPQRFHFMSQRLQVYSPEAISKAQEILATARSPRDLRLLHYDATYSLYEDYIQQYEQRLKRHRGEI